jgi:hypothetical protein
MKNFFLFCIAGSLLLAGSIFLAACTPKTCPNGLIFDGAACCNALCPLQCPNGYQPGTCHCTCVGGGNPTPSVSGTPTPVPPNPNATPGDLGLGIFSNDTTIPPGLPP